MKLTKLKVGIVGGLGTLLGTVFTYKCALQDKIDGIILKAQTDYARENYGLLDGYDANDLIEQINETLSDPNCSDFVREYCNTLLTKLNGVASTAVPYPDVYTMSDVLIAAGSACMTGLVLTSIIAYCITCREIIKENRKREKLYEFEENFEF